MSSLDISTKPGAHTLREILSQPHCWRECFEELNKSKKLASAISLAAPGAEWLFIGCGTSYYLAMAAASTFIRLGFRARAVPASEVLLHPELTMPLDRDYVPVMISRSGATSEVLRATYALEKEPQDSCNNVRKKPATGLFGERHTITLSGGRGKHGDDPLLYLDAAWAAISWRDG